MSPALPGDEPRFDLLVAGHTNIDRFLEVDELPAADRTVPLTAERAALGGTAATIARTAARSGVRTALISRIGSDFPEAFLAELRRDGVNISGLERVPEVLSPVCYVIEDGKGHQVTLIHQGPMGEAEGAAIPEEVLGSARWLHLTTGAPEYLLELKRVAREAGVRVAIDPAQEIHYVWTAPLLRRLLPDTEILFGNTSEIDRARKLVGAKRLEGLLEHVPMIVRTEGAEGVTAFHRDGKVHVPAPRVKGGHRVTGAGDAFRGHFYAAFFEGAPLEEALVAGARGAIEHMVKSHAASRPTAR